MAVDYAKIEKMIILELQKELLGQGHKATGSLINSMEGQTMVLPNSVVIEILMDDYSQYVNDGRKPGGKKVPIAVLVDWIERKGIASGRKDIKNAAFAIQQKIFKEGSPTSGSFKFSNNGRRAGFIDFVIENKLDPILNELGDEVFQEFDSLVADIVKDFNKNNV
jgi:hypothetical protein